MFLRRAKIRPNVNRAAKSPQIGPVKSATTGTSNSDGITQKQSVSPEITKVANEPSINKTPTVEQSDGNSLLEKPNSGDISVSLDDKTVTPTKNDLPSAKDLTPVNENFRDSLLTEKSSVSPRKELGVSEEDCLITRKEPVTPAKNLITPRSNSVTVSESSLSQKDNSTHQAKDTAILCKDSELPRKDGMLSANECSQPGVIPVISDSDVLDGGPRCQHTSPVKPVKKTRNEKEVPRFRRWSKEPPERSKMTMMDLIYYNPSDNRMTSPATKNSRKEQKMNDVIDARRDSTSSNNKEVDEPDYAAPAPRLKIGEDGQIILDEESLIIQHAVPESLSVITEETDTNYFSFRNRIQPRRWSVGETTLFYRALMTVGTDFSLMAQLIQNRTRYELKLKFKSEEKKNRPFIDELLRFSNATDIKDFQKVLDEFYNPENHYDELHGKKKGSRGTKSNVGKPRKAGRPRKKGQDSDTENLEPSKKKSRTSYQSDIIENNDESCSSTGLTNAETHEGEIVDDPSTQLDAVANGFSTDSSQSEIQVIPKKRRGRPRKAVIRSSDEDTTVTAAEGSVSDKTVNCKKRRGRKPRAGTTKTEINTSELLNGDVLTSDVEMIHIDTSDLSGSANISLESPRIVLVSETGEEFPVEVIYEETSNASSSKASNSENQAEDVALTATDINDSNSINNVSTVDVNNCASDSDIQTNFHDGKKVVTENCHDVITAKDKDKSQVLSPIKLPEITGNHTVSNIVIDFEVQKNKEDGQGMPNEVEYGPFDESEKETNKLNIHRPTKFQKMSKSNVVFNIQTNFEKDEKNDLQTLHEAAKLGAVADSGKHTNGPNATCPLEFHEIVENGTVLNVHTSSELKMKENSVQDIHKVAERDVAVESTKSTANQAKSKKVTNDAIMNVQISFQETNKQRDIQTPLGVAENSVVTESEGDKKMQDTSNPGKLKKEVGNINGVHSGAKTVKNPNTNSHVKSLSVAENDTGNDSEKNSKQTIATSSQKLQKVNPTSTAVKPKYKRRLPVKPRLNKRTVKEKDKDELECVRDAVNLILAEKPLKDPVILSPETGNTEIAAYVTLEPKKLGRKGVEISVQQEPARTKSSKAKYSDFTVTEDSLVELTESTPGLTNDLLQCQQQSTLSSFYENFVQDFSEVSSESAVFSSTLVNISPENCVDYSALKNISSTNNNCPTVTGTSIILPGSICPEGPFCESGEVVSDNLRPSVIS